MVLQKLEIIERLENGKSWTEVVASDTSVSSAVCKKKKQKDQFWSFMTSSDSEKDLSKQQTLKEPKLVQLAKVLM